MPQYKNRRENSAVAFHFSSSTERCCYSTMYNLCDLPTIQRGVLKVTHFSHPLRDGLKY
jgi:hypothetical protein